MNRRIFLLMAALVLGVTAMLYVVEWGAKSESLSPPRSPPLTAAERLTLTQTLDRVRQQMVAATNAADLYALRVTERVITNALARP